MVLQEHEIAELKGQLKQQIEHLPETQRFEAERQIDSLSVEALESMLERQRAQQQIYRMIVSGELESVSVGQNDAALAVMEIRPLARGHVLVIPKQPVANVALLPSPVKEFAAGLRERIRDRLGAKNIIQRENVKFGEAIIELVPEYEGGETTQAQGPPAAVSFPELQKVADEITREVVRMEKNVEVITKEPSVSEADQEANVVRLSRRIP